MSGGAFDYREHHIDEIVETIEEAILTNDSIEKNEWGDDVGRHYSEETISEFKKAVEILKLAKVYAHRIDWLLSGDDGEDSFHERLGEDLKNI
jgi:hypothetical protein